MYHHVGFVIIIREKLDDDDEEKGIKNLFFPGGLLFGIMVSLEAPSSRLRTAGG